MTTPLPPTTASLFNSTLLLDKSNVAVDPGNLQPLLTVPRSELPTKFHSFRVAIPALDMAAQECIPVCYGGGGRRGQWGEGGGGKAQRIVIVAPLGAGELAEGQSAFHIAGEKNIYFGDCEAGKRRLPSPVSFTVSLGVEGCCLSPGHFHPRLCVGLFCTSTCEISELPLLVNAPNMCVQVGFIRKIV